MGGNKDKKYLNVVQTKRTPKYKYLYLNRDERIKDHKKGVYPKRSVARDNLGPIIALGPPDKSKKKLAQMETKNLNGKEKEIAMELIMLGFYHAGNKLFVKGNKYYVDLGNRKEVKRKQKSYPKDTKIPFKNIVILTTLDHILPKGYLCNYTLRK